MQKPSKPSNGRIDIFNPKTYDLFQMYDKIPVNQCTTLRNPMEGVWDNTQLSISFFSQANIQIIQNAIRYGVYTMSNNQYIISEQDADTLKIIMRSVFLQNAVNQPDNIKEQIEQLNTLVLNYAIPQVYNEAKGYYKYLSDASTMYTPIAHPVLSSNHDKQLVLKPWF
jgi:hypothetical protein